jgi:hypothetical protein
MGLWPVYLVTLLYKVDAMISVSLYFLFIILFNVFLVTSFQINWLVIISIGSGSATCSKST